MLVDLDAQDIQALLKAADTVIPMLQAKVRKEPAEALPETVRRLEAAREKLEVARRSAS
jgi:hypothetical protein